MLVFCWLLMSNLCLRCEGTSCYRPVHVLHLCPLQTHQPPQKQQVQLPQQVSSQLGSLASFKTKIVFSHKIQCTFLIFLLKLIGMLLPRNRKCPTPGCDGSGHVTGRFTAHHCISGCPLAERNQGRLKAELSDTECKRNLFFGQRNKKNHYRGRLGCVRVIIQARFHMSHTQVSDIKLVACFQDRPPSEV